MKVKKEGTLKYTKVNGTSYLLELCNDRQRRSKKKK